MTSPVDHLTRNGHLGRYFIAGRWVAPKGTDTAEMVNPATEKVLCRIPLGNAQDVDERVAAAARAFTGWSRTRGEERVALLARLEALFEENAELLSQCMSLEMGAAIGYARVAQHAPFGGYNQSGNGREYGREGMLEYLEVKSILGFFAPA